MSVAGRTWYAHRLAWTLWRGPIPAGMFVCHRCDNRRCAAPAHLFLGDVGDNNRDMTEKGRNAAQRFSSDDVAAMRARHEKRVRYPHPSSFRAIQEDYGVSRTHLYQILRGEVRV